MTGSQKDRIRELRNDGFSYAPISTRTRGTPSEDGAGSNSMSPRCIVQNAAASKPDSRAGMITSEELQKEAESRFIHCFFIGLFEKGTISREDLDNIEKRLSELYAVFTFISFL